MRTLTYALGWTSQGLLGLLIVLALRGKYFTKYPVFYSYLSFLMAGGLLRVCVLTLAPDRYLITYWSTQLLVVAGTYCVLWEIYRKVLAPFEGAAKMASGLVLAVFFTVLGKTFFSKLLAQDRISAWVMELERDLHTVQAILLLLLVSLILYYRIPVGRNLRGMIFGYGFFVGASIILLTLRSYIGTSFQVGWQYLQQASTLGTFLIWCFTLYSYQPSPLPEAETELERDYALIAGRTQRTIARARGYLVRQLVS